MRAVIAAFVVGAAVFGIVALVTLRPSGDAQQARGEGSGAAAPGFLQRDQGEGAVEIEVIHVTAEYLRSGGADARRYEPDRYAVFLVAMNTHSVDLSAYDMLQISELRVGGTAIRPLRWVSTSDDGHHRSGALLFPKLDAPQPVELLIKTIAGVPVRTFRWAP